MIIMIFPETKNHQKSSNIIKNHQKSSNIFPSDLFPEFFRVAAGSVHPLPAAAAAPDAAAASPGVAPRATPRPARPWPPGR
jgi:hypothetical protein